ncbi:hypothetical protein BED47_07290 [Gottfriedia luciferensis]|uniref:Uncharacterized protein n=1 Tax=Gottfriedia luciferensis TaxID=178774 RepID=A0ABX2ZPC6_9BACI|nr:hypothetical protein [Gottfriedia luciferensis]ODG91453.1 hypothetical protein BED47_07290 [Gottfriedia luciferensis]
MSCNCNNERNNERNNDWHNNRNNDWNNNRNNNRNNRRDREITFNAKVTVNQEEFCRAVDRCDNERRDNNGRRSDRWWNF